ncbi:MAG: hypothetical protein H0W06_00575 [Chloroflexia bacterium]|nr:hypothetical protein [Chloroflexia bacterium]
MTAFDNQFTATSAGQVPCTYHPKVQTGLRCSRCGKPICPQCAVRTPVGLRCPDCAGVRGLPTYRTDPSVLLRAIGAGLLVALGTAVLWRFLPGWGFYLSLLLGFGVVETMSYLAKHKRGPDLKFASLAVIALGLLLSRVLLAQRFGVSLADVNALSDAVFTPAVFETYGGPVAATDLLRLRLIPDIVYAVLPFVIAWFRFR